MPDYANGKICYIDIPATDIAKSAEFYRNCFGWEIRTRSNGSVAFNDAVNQVSGTWSTGRTAASDPGFLIYIMVDDIERAVEKVKANGGEITQAVGADHPELTARFRDPAGNVLGLYQEPSL